MKDITMVQFIDQNGQAESARMLGVKRQTVWSWLNRDGEWWVRIGRGGKPEGYYKMIVVA